MECMRPMHSLYNFVRLLSHQPFLHSMPFCTCPTRCKGGKDVSERTWKNHAPLQESQPAIPFSQNLSNFLDNMRSTRSQQEQSNGNHVEHSRSPPPGSSKNQRQRAATPEHDPATSPDPGPPHCQDSVELVFMSVSVDINSS
jgi:hypothetical protein